MLVVAGAFGAGSVAFAAAAVMLRGDYWVLLGLAALLGGVGFALHKSGGRRWRFVFSSSQHDLTWFRRDLLGFTWTQVRRESLNGIVNARVCVSRNEDGPDFIGVQLLRKEGEPFELFHYVDAGERVQKETIANAITEFLLHAVEQ